MQHSLLALSLFFSFPPLPVDKGQEKTTYREGLVDDNTVGDQGTEEGTRVPVGTGLGVESSPVRDVESCADEHREMAQPPNELGTLLIHGGGLQDDKKGFIPLAMALFSLPLSVKS